MFATVRATLVVWIAAALLLVGVGALVGVFIAQRPGAESAMLALRSDRAAQALIRSEFDAQLQSVQSRLQESESDVLMERAVRVELEKSLARAQTELGQLKDSLAFYEQLLPPGPKGEIALRAVDLELEDGAIAYRILLMRSGKSGERFAGNLQFTATGLEHGAPATFILQPLQSSVGESASSSADTRLAEDRSDRAMQTLRLEFEQFQRSQGLLALPEGFKPESVTVQVLEEGIILVSRRVDL